MKHNARYKGGSGTGVDLLLLLADGQHKPRHIDQGEALPTEVGAIPVDPGFVANLLEQADWEPIALETPAQRKARELAEHDLAEQQAAANAAAAEAIERVKAEQKARHKKEGTS